MALLELVELLERQRIDRAQQAQLAVELADATGRRGPFGQLGLLGGLGDVRLDVEVATQRLDRVLEPQLGLGFLDLGAVRSLPRLVERPLGVVTAPCGRRRAPPSAPAPRRSGGGAARPASSCSTSITVRCAGDESSQPLDRDDRPLDLLAAFAAAARASTSAASRRSVSAIRCSRNCWRSWSPALRTSSSRRRDASTAARASSSARASPRARAASASACSSASSVGSTASSSVMRTRSTAMWAIRSAIDRSSPSQLGLQLAPLTEHAGQPFRSGGEPGVVLVEPAVERAARAGVPPRARRRPSASACSAAAEAHRPRRRRVSRASSSAAAVAPPAAAPTRQPVGREPVAAPGDEHGAGMGERCRPPPRRRRRPGRRRRCSASSRPDMPGRPERT